VDTRGGDVVDCLFINVHGTFEVERREDGGSLKETVDLRDRREFSLGDKSESLRGGNSSILVRVRSGCILGSVPFLF